MSQQLFKYLNVGIGAITLITSMSHLTYVFTEFNVFIQAIFALLFSAFIIILEFRIPSNIYKFASFYFSFVGRGVLNILLCSLLAHGSSLLTVLDCILLFTSGLAFIFFQFTKLVEEPESFKVENNSFIVGDDEFDVNDNDDDEVI